ncbi:MAG: potassium channel protein [Ignavibacteriae bacterium]|nr:MAG: potassium channel protein [Ignavibacteriota bacterium]
MNIFKKLEIGLLLILSVILSGTIGYMIIEGWSFIDSFYMTIITISTTGFKEIRPLSTPGMILTVFLIIMGVVAIAYTGGRGVQLLVETQILRKKKMERKLSAVSDHYIICGFGRMGKQIAEHIKENELQSVVIENEPNNVNTLEELNYLFVNADATDDDALIKAGVERAKGLVAVLGTDAENVFTTLSARELNSKLFIVSRAIDEGTEGKLKKAGADRVVKPYELGGNRMVQLLLRPGVTDFIEGIARKKEVDISLEQIIVSKNSNLIGLTLAQSPIRKELDIIIIAIDKSHGKFVYNPKSSTIIEGGDKLIAIGHVEKLNKLNKICVRVS